jgi:hypothetical protein
MLAYFGLFEGKKGANLLKMGDFLRYSPSPLWSHPHSPGKSGKRGAAHHSPVIFVES